MLIVRVVLAGVCYGGSTLSAAGSVVAILLSLRNIFGGSSFNYPVNTPVGVGGVLVGVGVATLLWWLGKKIDERIDREIDKEFPVAP